DDHGLWRRAGNRHPVVAGRVGFDGQAQPGDLAAEPVTSVAPDRSPRQALRSVGGAGALLEFTQSGNNALCVHRDTRYQFFGCQPAATRTLRAWNASAYPVRDWHSM